MSSPRSGGAIEPFIVHLSFHGDLSFFLKRTEAGATVDRTLEERTSVKDVIELCGIPHPELDLVTVDKEPVTFSHVLHKNSLIYVYSVDLTSGLVIDSCLQQRGIARFVADGHLGKLTRNLRLLGIDVASPEPSEDRLLLEVMQRENRALLTRDRPLLMHSVVENGFCPRSQIPSEQTAEVLRRFELYQSIKPFSRCLRCNGRLQEVDKEQVNTKLEPLTRIYYERFRQCQDCGQIYWAGSHFDKLSTRIEEFRAN